MLWRFLPASDKNVDVMISRDADSWLNTRESVCVNDWIKSNSKFHIIRDHCYHSQKIMGGMWGIKRDTILNMDKLINEYVKSKSYDQDFLADYIYPNILTSVKIHIGDQKNNKGKPAYGYHTISCCEPIPQYILNDEPIKNLSFKKINNINKFKCIHCNKFHNEYIGGIMSYIPKESLIVLQNYFNYWYINTDIIDKLIFINTSTNKYDTVMIIYNNNDKFINDIIPLFYKYLSNLKIILLKNKNKINEYINIYKNKTKFYLIHDANILPNERYVKRYYQLTHKITRLYSINNNSLNGILKIEHDTLIKVNGYCDNLYDKLKNIKMSKNYKNNKHFTVLPIS